MKIEIPKTCPCCEYPLELVNEQLFCRNTSCSAQLNKKLEHFCKVLGIKGFGPRTVEKLNLQDLTEIYYLDHTTAVEALGSEKLAEKLLNEIEKSKSADLATVLSAFSIPLLGNTAATKICQIVSSVDEINYETCKAAGLGDKVTQNLLNWLDTDFREMREFLPFSFTSAKQVTSSVDLPTVCITGKLQSFKTKAEAHKALVDSGYKPVDSVTKSLKFLVDEGEEGSSKRKKAEQYGITIVNNLIEFLKEGK